MAVAQEGYLLAVWSIFGFEARLVLRRQAFLISELSGVCEQFLVLVLDADAI